MNIILFIKRLTFLLVFLLVITADNYSQNLNQSRAAEFVRAFIHDGNDLSNFLLRAEYRESKRLGVSYFESKNKFLISNDIPTLLRNQILNKSLKYKYKVLNADCNFSILKFNIPSKKLTRNYFFYRSFLVSRPFYYSINWKIRKSKYFVFHISDTAFFNKYAVKKLDDFVDKKLKLLQFTKKEIEKLSEKKIDYFLCKSKSEVKLLTGYEARGLYYLPYDYIISTFNCHYHEIMHLLINYKLKKLHLYTLPLLQEGFAVAYGGRGGKIPGVILQMGMFLVKSNFLNYKSLLSKKEFYSANVSMSYPVAGLYVRSLVDKMGINKFLNLYRKYSGNEVKINKVKIDLSNLPPDSEWQEYSDKYESDFTIKISDNKIEDFPKSIVQTKNYKIYENSNSYLFELKTAITLTTQKPFSSYRSKLFKELIPGKKYKSQKYIITADSNEISVYNFYSNNLIAKYVKSFTIENKPVPLNKGFYSFSISKNVFDNRIGNMKIQ